MRTMAVLLRLLLVAVLLLPPRSTKPRALRGGRGLLTSSGEGGEDRRAADVAAGCVGWVEAEVVVAAAIREGGVKHRVGGEGDLMGGVIVPGEWKRCGRVRLLAEERGRPSLERAGQREVGEREALGESVDEVGRFGETGGE